MDTKKQNPDGLLLEKLKEGGREMNNAINQLMKMHKGEMITFFKGKGCDTEDAKEFFYEGLSILVLNVRSGKFRGASSIRTYLYGICKNLWRSSLRSSKVRSDYVENQQVIAKEEDDEQEYIIMGNDLKRLLNGLLSQLRDKCDKVLSMWAMHYSMTEIADAMEYANAQVAMNKKNKCMKQLSQIVAESPTIRKELNNARF